MKKFIAFVLVTGVLTACSLSSSKELVEPLWQAARDGNMETVQSLLDQGANVDPSCDPNALCKPLLHAAENGHIEIMELLIEAGADVNAIDGHHGPAHMYALNAGQYESAYFLIDNGADVNLHAEQGVTPLAVAIFLADMTLYDYVIEETDVTERFFEDTTYLTFLGSVATLSNEEIMMIMLDDLLERGVDPFLENTYGETALDFASRNVDIPGLADVPVSEAVVNRLSEIDE